MKKQKILDIIMWAIAVLVSLAIGGTFVDGGYLGTTILKLIPATIHTIVGWIIIIGTLGSAVIKFTK